MHVRKQEETKNQRGKPKTNLSQETMAPLTLRGRMQMAALRKQRFKSKAKHRRNGMKTMRESFKRLKTEMEEISEEQKNIREGQRQVKKKFEAIETECEELKRETRLIIQQSARTQVKLALMFRILKAREAGDFNIAAHFTEILRPNMYHELVTEDDDNKTILLGINGE
ncbi:uncharacterized protein LOC110417898 isoform X2 [Herrania umbratica]|uniref:Uncharacterized protein LOC110417898 isoform X2 n=1 Tax=Herrania umbratica TaxID=108875 RepID=A0A6J1AH81_9ROSI|nr:uncharacterized protein LOC110417898 isoform X2 [Herrania umbratica]